MNSLPVLNSLKPIQGASTRLNDTSDNFTLPSAFPLDLTVKEIKGNGKKKCDCRSEKL